MAGAAPDSIRARTCLLREVRRHQRAQRPVASIQSLSVYDPRDRRVGGAADPSSRACVSRQLADGFGPWSQ